MCESALWCLIGTCADCVSLSQGLRHPIADWMLYYINTEVFWFISSMWQWLPHIQDLFDFLQIKLYFKTFLHHFFAVNVICYTCVIFSVCLCTTLCYQIGQLPLLLYPLPVSEFRTSQEAEMGFFFFCFSVDWICGHQVGVFSPRTLYGRLSAMTKWVWRSRNESKPDCWAPLINSRWR